MHFKKAIYIDIEALFDTRQGSMAVINPDFAAKITSQENYYSRDCDEFEHPEYGLLNGNLLNSIKKAYPDKVIRSSLKTRMHLFIKHLLQSTIEKNLAQSVSFELSFEINVFPYVMTEAEKAELASVFSSIYDHQFKVNIISVDLLKVPFKQATKHYIAMVMYHYGQWIEANKGKIGTNNNTMVIYAPRLYFNKKEVLDKLPSAISELKKDNQEPFEFIETLYSQFIQFNFIPVSFFCVDLPSNPEDYTKPEDAH
jgi:hypothetical protein